MDSIRMTFFYLFIEKIMLTAVEYLVLKIIPQIGITPIITDF